MNKMFSSTINSTNRTKKKYESKINFNSHINKTIVKWSIPTTLITNKADKPSLLKIVFVYNNLSWNQIQHIHYCDLFNNEVYSKHLLYCRPLPTCPILYFIHRKLIFGSIFLKRRRRCIIFQSAHKQERSSFLFCFIHYLFIISCSYFFVNCFIYIFLIKIKSYSSYCFKKSLTMKNQPANLIALLWIRRITSK